MAKKSEGMVVGVCNCKKSVSITPERHLENRVFVKFRGWQISFNAMIQQGKRGSKKRMFSKEKWEADGAISSKLI